MKCWCPRQFQRQDKEQYRYYSHSDIQSQPMYVALNTKHFSKSLVKAHWQQQLMWFEKLKVRNRKMSSTNSDKNLIDS